MRIRKVSIKNYRQYRDIVLDLSDPRSDFVVVVGSNGTGKTNLLNAIIWALYGREDYYSRKMETSPLVNQSALQEASQGELLACSVSLEMDFKDGAEATISRIQDFRKEGNGTVPQAPRLQVIAMESPEKGFKSANNPEHWVERWIPSRLEPYFLFDGERLDDFFRHAEAQKVKNAVLEIAQIDLLARAVDHLEKVSARLYTNVSRQKGAEGTADLGTQLDAKHKRLGEVQADLERRQASVAAFEDSVRKLEARIGGIETVVADVQQRRQLQDHLAQIQQHLQESWGELFGWAARVAPAVLVADDLGVLGRRIDEARRDRRLPPPVAPTILRDLLDQTQCVCGRSLEPGTDAREHIEHLLEEYAHVGQVGTVLLSLEPSVRTLSGRLAETDSVAASTMRRIDDWEKRLRSTSEDLSVLEARLAGHEDAEVAQIQEELTKARTALAGEQRTIARLEVEKEGLQDEIAKVEKNLEALASREEKLKALIHEAQFSRHCLGVARDIYQSLTDEVRTTVAHTLDTEFKRMIWKRDFFEEVSIDDQYRVSVRNKLGFEILHDLAAGERECLALAFALALSEVAGYELPMVIDTPMGRLNPDVQAYVSQVLAESTKPDAGGGGHQLIMLMTETEYNKEVAAVLAARDPRVFRIDFDTNSAVSTLTEVV